MSVLRRGATEIRRRKHQLRGAASWTRTCGERQLICRTATPGPPRARILCYHSIGTPRWGVNDVPPRLFARQLERAMKAGYQFVPAADLAAADATVPDRRVALTFDDGLRSLLTNAAPVLADLGVPWTAFVVTDWADGHHGLGEDLLLTWAEIEKLASAGAVVASHSVTHPDFSTLERGRAVDELERSRSTIRERLGIDTTEFAIPFGQSGNWSPDTHAAAMAAGYTTVYAQSVHRRPLGTVPRTFVTRFDTDRIFTAALAGAFDEWEEWF